MLAHIIRYFLENRLVTWMILLALVAWGIATAPFNWKSDWFPRDPVPVDAIPDIGENQQIVYANWPGRSPQDVDDQITYPLTTALLGIPGVSTVRSTSMFGFSSIYIIFTEDVEFYWSRSRILEKINALPEGLLPDGVQPALGPDATALGQIFWYTLEARDPATGRAVGGWDPQELRTIQDFYVRYALNSVEGVSEVSSVGGYVKEYQVDIDPDAMRAAGVTVEEIMDATRKSNRDVGARTVEMNRVEYLIRGLGYIKSSSDIEESVVRVNDFRPIRIKDVARVNLGPAMRRGGLDKNGVEAVGGVVVARYRSNPMEVINLVKAKIEEIAPGLPSRKLADGTTSKVTVVPFYDRTGLIKETLGTLESALSHEILISIIVVIALVINLRASLLVSVLLPIAVLTSFIVMRYTGVDANVVSLAGIAIAIGVMVDVAIVFVENILRHLDMEENRGAKGKALIVVIQRAAAEVATAITTALATTVVSFLPVFALQAAEGRLFRPLAITKTIALSASFMLGLIAVPTIAYMLFNIRVNLSRVRRTWSIILITGGIILLAAYSTLISLALVAIGINNLFQDKWPEAKRQWPDRINVVIALFAASWFLTHEWLPLGPEHTFFTNMLFVVTLAGLILAVLLLMVKYYEPVLRWCLANKKTFLAVPLVTVFLGVLIWQGADKILGFLSTSREEKGSVFSALKKTFPGVGKEFMPALDEGSFLLMPSTMPHAGVEENVSAIRVLDASVHAIPEVEDVVGKWGRVGSALDPAPISMFENIVNVRPEYILDEDGHRVRFKIDDEGYFVLKGNKRYNLSKEGFRLIPRDSLIEDGNGDYFRQWRPEIRERDDIWKAIVARTDLPGMTSAPKLQPIQTRLIMLQTGMRAPMGIKVYGPDLASIEEAGLQLERVLKEVPVLERSSVFADRIIGKPYLELKIDREAIARYGLSMDAVQSIIEGAIGGMELTTTVEGRERFAVRVRYARELRDDPDDIKNILVATPMGVQVPLGELAEVTYRRGPQMIRSEDTFLTGYIIFDKKGDVAEVDAVEEARAVINAHLEDGTIALPPGVSFRFTGNYENQERASKRLGILIPVSLLIIFMLLYVQFKTVTASAIHFSGVFVALAGGFIMIWLYGQPWFMNFDVIGINIRHLFQMHTINLSVAVWVGFIALFGIATDDGVIMGTYIHQVFERRQPASVTEVREAVVEAGKKRVRPAVMTAAVAIIALLPILTSTGKGADIMLPMAIPMFGGMIIQSMTMFVVPVLQAIWRERVVTGNSQQNAIEK